MSSPNVPGTLFGLSDDEEVPSGGPVGRENLKDQTGGIFGKIETPIVRELTPEQRLEATVSALRSQLLDATENNQLAALGITEKECHAASQERLLEYETKALALMERIAAYEKQYQDMETDALPSTFSPSPVAQAFRDLQSAKAETQIQLFLIQRERRRRNGTPHTGAH